LVQILSTSPQIILAAAEHLPGQSVPVETTMETGNSDTSNLNTNTNVFQTNKQNKKNKNKKEREENLEPRQLLVSNTVSMINYLINFVGSS
jgi:hypothetical protein